MFLQKGGSLQKRTPPLTRALICSDDANKSRGGLENQGSTPQPSTREADVCEFRLGRQGGPSMTGAGPSMAVGQSPEPDPWQVDLL